MKALWLIGGPMGVGKSSVGRALRDGLPRSIYLDGDWCWDASPFVVNAETKAMVMKNIRFLLRSFLECSEYKNVILAWVMHEQAIIDGLTEGLTDCRVIAVSLVCSERELERRIRKDEAAGLRAPDSFERARAYLPLYAGLRTIKLDTTGLSTAETAEKIAELSESDRRYIK